ncbi:hypothetical protein [Marinimicrococcus flavescens]|uniref:Uncharacterized protein n=1 Tax=Marinimicrococcus flavescens TaxID=3031815 RepID=A0AAP3XRD9_9PROT|nr:hypothetical protein [Marinimicrococcus flavescens]
MVPRAYACHEYVSAADGATGCGAYRRDRDAGTGAPEPAPSPAPDSGNTAPVSTGSDLPFGGRFYGNPYMCDTVYDVGFYNGSPVAKRIIAEHNGELSAIRWHNRYGSGYSEGDGGRVVIKIEGDRDGKPSGQVLGETEVNGGRGSMTSQGFFPQWSFRQPVKLSQGKAYHVVWYQVGSTGYVTVNFHYAYSPIPAGKKRGGPYEGDDCTIHRGSGAGWKLHATHGGFIQLYHKDGVTTGCPMVFSSSGFQKTYGGGTMIRQRFTMDGQGRTVDGLWVRTWYKSGSPGDLIIHVMQTGGAMLADLRIKASEVAQTPNRLDYPDQPGNPPATWVYRKFDKPLTLKPSEPYEVRLSTDYGSYHIHAVQLGDPRWHGATSRNAWTDGRAEFSTNSGGSWHGWDDTKEAPGRARTDVLLPLAFSVATLRSEVAECT